MTSAAPTLYLIGVDHLVQWRRGIPATQEFVEYLAEQTRDHHVSVLAEEWFDGMNALNRVTSTTVQDLAGTRGLTHVFVDPNDVQRQQIGWRSSADDDVRERFWLDALSLYADKRILLVCGSGHLNSFALLATTSGWHCEVLPRRYGGPEVFQLCRLS